MDPMDVFQHACVAACHAWLGDDTAAAAHARSVLKLDPDFTVDTHMTTQHYFRDEDRAHHREGLLKAGLPESGE